MFFMAKNYTKAKVRITAQQNGDSFSIGKRCPYTHIGLDLFFNHLPSVSFLVKPPLNVAL